jgi:hypothetical protein
MDDLSKYDLSSLKKISVGGRPAPELVKSVYEKTAASLSTVQVTKHVRGHAAGDSVRLICGSVGSPICAYDTLD